MGPFEQRWHLAGSAPSCSVSDMHRRYVQDASSLSVRLLGRRRSGFVGGPVSNRLSVAGLHIALQPLAAREAAAFAAGYQEAGDEEGAREGRGGAGSGFEAC